MTREEAEKLFKEFEETLKLLMSYKFGGTRLADLKERIIQAMTGDK